MKYIKLFYDTSSADGFRINDIPWIAYEKQRKRAFVCNELGKQLKFINNEIIITDRNSLLDTSLYCYNSTDGFNFPFDPEIALFTNSLNWKNQNRQDFENSCHYYYNMLPNDMITTSLYHLMFFAIYENAFKNYNEELKSLGLPEISQLPKIPITLLDGIIFDGAAPRTSEHDYLDKDVFIEPLQCAVDNIDEIFYCMKESAGGNVDYTLEQLIEIFQNCIDNIDEYWKNMMVNDNMLEKFKIYSNNKNDYRFISWSDYIRGYGTPTADKCCWFCFKIKGSILYEKVYGGTDPDHDIFNDHTQILCFGNLETDEGPVFLYAEVMNGQKLERWWWNIASDFMSKSWTLPLYYQDYINDI